MSLEKLLAKVKTDFLPSSKARTRDYVAKYELKDYFGDDVPQEYRDKFSKGLDRITNEVTDKYASELRSLVRTPVGKGTMALAVANDLSAYITTTPFDNVTALGYALFAAKTAVEVPAAIRYMRKTKSWYGALDVAGHFLLKPVRYLLPIIGPALESGAFERMVKRRVRKEIVRKFAEAYGKYEPLEDRIKERVKEPLREHVYIKEKEEELVGV
ncbi:MAG: hypothetical protein AABX10_02130 [Nanoarchaeota archaeon]